MSDRAGVLVVFARSPEKGLVKTRLAPAVGHDGALRLHRAFLHDTITHAKATGYKVVLARTPGPPFEHGADVTVVQRGEDFGARFDHALTDAHEAGRPVVIVGSDTPHLRPARIAAAFHALTQADAVVGRAPRGGFHLLGFRGQPMPVREVFDADDQVVALHALLQRHGLDCAEVPALDDVDEPEDLARLARRLAADAGLAPQSLDALRSVGFA